MAVMNLNDTDMFLGYDWLVKYNLEVSWNIGTIWFTIFSREYKIRYQDITFTSRIQRLQPTDNKDKKQQNIGKELDLTNLENLIDYIQLFTHLFNKKKFEKLPKQREWDHKINLTEDAPKKLNVKACAMTVKEDKALSQWLDEQLRAELIVESSL